MSVGRLTDRTQDLNDSARHASTNYKMHVCSRKNFTLRTLLLLVGILVSQILIIALSTMVPQIGMIVNNPATLFNSGQKPKAAVVILADLEITSGHATELYTNLEKNLLGCPFLSRYPLYIYHNSALNGSDVRYFEKWCSRLTSLISGLVIYHYNIESYFKVPDFVLDDIRHAGYDMNTWRSWTSPELQREFSMNYRIMCRWQFKGLWEQPEIKELDYILRLDTDSQWHSCDPDYDPILYSYQHKKSYGYRFQILENRDCVRNLPDTILTFIKKYNITPAEQRLWYRQTVLKLPMQFYTNLELVSVPFMLSNNSQLFIDYIDKSMGIFKHRWGDGPLRLVTATLFLQCKDWLFLDHGVYFHTNIRNSRGICSAKDTDMQ